MPLTVLFTHSISVLRAAFKWNLMESFHMSYGYLTNFKQIYILSRIYHVHSHRILFTHMNKCICICTFKINAFFNVISFVCVICERECKGNSFIFFFCFHFFFHIFICNEFNVSSITSLFIHIIMILKIHDNMTCEIK